LGKSIIVLLILVLLMGSSSFAFIKSVSALSDDSWTSKASMQQARYGLGVAAINGKIFAIGGQTGNLDAGYAVLSSNEEYNPVTDTWVFRTEMPTARSFFATAVFQNKIYCIGGRDRGGLTGATGVNEVYDPSTDTWTTKASMPTPRMGLTASVVGDKIYIFGGGSNEILVYDPIADRWTRKTPMTVAPGLWGEGWSCASVVVDNKIHVIGAFPQSSSHQVYDPVTDSWSFGEPTITGYYFAAVGVTSGVNAPRRIYVFGSGSNHWAMRSPGFTSQNYDFKDNRWSVGMPVPSERFSFGIAVVDDRIYAIGGGTPTVGSSVMVLATAELYLPFGYGTLDPSYVPPTEGELPTETFPTVKVLSPLTQTYKGSSVPLVFTVDKHVDWLGYSLNGEENVTVLGNTTLTGLSSGSHNITVFAKDTFGNTGASETVTFTVSSQLLPTVPIVATSGATIAIAAVSLVYYYKKRRQPAS
jgi:hypothetical protein